jgi:hypothetical protein
LTSDDDGGDRENTAGDGATVLKRCQDGLSVRPGFRTAASTRGFSDDLQYARYRKSL